MYGSHWWEKNVLLKEWFDNYIYMNKIFFLSGKSQWYSDTLVSWVLAIQLCGRKICVKSTSHRQRCKQLLKQHCIGMEILYKLKCSLSSKAEMGQLKEILKDQTCDNNCTLPCIHQLPKEMVWLMSSPLSPPPILSSNLTKMMQHIYERFQ